MKLKGTRAKVNESFSVFLPPFAVGLDYWHDKLEQAIFEKSGHRVAVEFETSIIEEVKIGGSYLAKGSFRGSVNTVTGVSITIDNEDDAVEFALRYL